MARQRSIESRLKEHERYRRQCAKRIPASFAMFLLATALCGYVVYRDRTFIWYAVGIAGFFAFYAFGEIIAYYRHGRLIREQSGAGET